MWLCDVPSTWVKSPPTIILEPSAVTASAFTSASADGAHEVSEPVDVSNAAGRVRAAPATVAKSPPT